MSKNLDTFTRIFETASEQFDAASDHDLARVQELTDRLGALNEELRTDDYTRAKGECLSAIAS